MTFSISCNHYNVMCQLNYKSRSVLSIKHITVVLRLNRKGGLERLHALLNRHESICLVPDLHVLSAGAAFRILLCVIVGQFLVNISYRNLLGNLSVCFKSCWSRCQARNLYPSLFWLGSKGHPSVAAETRHCTTFRQLFPRKGCTKAADIFAAEKGIAATASHIS